MNKKIQNIFQQYEDAIRALLDMAGLLNQHTTIKPDSELYQELKAKELIARSLVEEAQAAEKELYQ